MSGYPGAGGYYPGPGYPPQNPPQAPAYSYDPQGQGAPGYGQYGQPAQAAKPPQPPQGQHHVTYVNVQQPGVHYVQNPRSTSSSAGGFLGGALGSAFRGAVNVVDNVSKEFVNEVDRHAISPLLNCFLPGCVVQLKSRICSSGGGCLRIFEPTGTIDARASIGNDYTSHFFVVSRVQNKVVLRSVANPAHHLCMANGQAFGTGIGDRASTFRIHETYNHYITFEHEMTGHLFGVDNGGLAVSSSYLRFGMKETEFEVHLMHSPFGHRYTPTH